MRSSSSYLKFLCLASLLWAFCAPEVFGQLYTFTGSVTSIDTPGFQIGDPIVLEYHLKSPLDNPFASSSNTAFFYQCDWTSLVIGGRTITTALPLSFMCGYNDYGRYGAEGTTIFQGFPAGTNIEFKMAFYSFVNKVSFENGLVKPDLPVSDFEFRDGWFKIDPAVGQVAGPRGTFQLTSYSVEGLPSSAVPEPSTYAWLGSLSLLVLATIRRLSKK